MQVETERVGGGDDLRQLPHQRVQRATRNSEATQRDKKTAGGDCLNTTLNRPVPEEADHGRISSV
jgi:hypothetical protein